MKKILLLCCILCHVATFSQFVTHGPITGAVSPTGARIYVRTTTASTIKIELATDAAFTTPLAFSDSTRDWRDSSNIVDISGLAPQTTYYTRIWVNGVLDTIRGSFKTFPTAGTKGHYSWGVLSCQEFGTYNAFTSLYNRKPDLVLHTGDFTYPDYQIPGDHRMDWSLQQLSYRKRYKEKNMEPSLLNTAYDYVPDNHDGAGQRDNVANLSFTKVGNTVTNIVTNDPVPPGAVENVFKGYYEYYPAYRPQDTTVGMYHNYMFGNCEIFFLDARHCGNGQDSTFTYNPVANQWSFDPKPGQTLLGDKQFAWLMNGLKNSTADWKFIVSQVMFNRQFRKVVQVGLGLQSQIFGFGTTTGTGFTLAHSLSSNWCSYPHEQDSLINFTRQHNINDVIVLSGHVHTNVMDNGHNAGFPELNTGPAAGYGAELTFYIDSVMQLLQQGAAIDSLWNGGGQGVNNRNFKSGFGMVDIFESDSVVMKIVDEDNATVSSMTILHSSIAPTGIKEPLEVQCVVESIYPNPANDMVTVKFCPEYRKKNTDRSYVIDLNGRVMTKSVPSTTFSVKELSPGKYLYVYDYGAEVKTFPLHVIR